MTDYKDSVNPASPHFTSQPTFLAPQPTYIASQPTYVAPQPMYLPQQSMNVSIINQSQSPSPTPAVFRPMGPKSMHYTCTSCGTVMMTNVNKRSTTKAHLSALLLCLVGCWPCCLCPYCMDDCLMIEHYCPNCKMYLGNYVN